VDQQIGLGIEMTDLLHSIREAIALPLWAQLLALVFVALSPLVIKKWRKGGANWHKSEK
jgi:hypothetical protein